MLKFILSLFLVLLSFQFSFSQINKLPEQSNPPHLYNNFSKEFPNFISQSEAQQLEEKLSNFATETSNQIVVVVTDDLLGLEPYAYATELGQKWGVGHEKEDNGIVILIKPTGGEGQRKYHIAVGYGLEGAIPDLTCRMIEENELLPYFKQGEYYKGLDQTTSVLMSLAKGEYNSKAYQKQNKKSPSFFIIAFILFAVVFFILSRKNGKGGGLTMGTGGMFYGGGFSGGGFGGGSSGGGGFGGFGGGGFGGGGSGGSW